MAYLAIFTELIKEALALGWVDWIVTLTALVYVVLAARQRVWAWAWGIVSCALWAYASFFFYHLWLDALLQIFYVVMGFVGIYKWMGKREKWGNGGIGEWEDKGMEERGNEEPGELPVTRLTAKQNAWILLGGSVAALLFGHFFDVYTPAAATYLDAFVTVFSIITTFLLVQKKLDNWAYWVAIDGASIYLFASRGAYLFAGIMIVYTLIAAQAFWQWQKDSWLAR